MKKKISTQKPFESDKYVQTWLTGLSDRTRKNYILHISGWLEFVGMSPTEQIEKRLKDTSSINMEDRTFFENKFRGYRESLEQKGTFRNGTIKKILIPVASFFGRNGLRLNLKRGDWEPKQEQEVTTTKFKCTKEDVKAMYNHGNTRDRALLLVLAQSGFSEVDVSCVRIEELKGLYSNGETEHYFIEKPREKTHEVQATCLSYEAVHDMKIMLQERGNPTEGYLFVSTTKNFGERLATTAIADAIRALALKAFGKEKAKDFKPKCLRSFYNSALLRADIKTEVKDLMMGHARLGARGHYDYDEQTIKDNYAKAFEHLSINGLQTRSDIAKLKQEFDLTKAQLADIMVKQKMDNDKLQNELMELKKYIGLTDVVETKEDAQRLLDVLETLRREKMAKNQET